MSKKPQTEPTNDEKGATFRFLVGAIKANLIGMFYDYDHHSFVTEDEVLTRVDKKFVVTGPLSFIEKTDKTAWGGAYKLQISTICRTDTAKKLISKLQTLFGLTAGSEQFKNPSFYFGAIMVVMRHLNSKTPENNFRKLVLAKKVLPDDTHFVYRYLNSFEMTVKGSISPALDLITEVEARSLSDVDCYLIAFKGSASVKDPIGRTAEIQKICTEQKCLIYLELRNPKDRNGALRELDTNYSVITNNWQSFQELNSGFRTNFKHIADEHLNNVNFRLSLDGDNRADIPKIPPFDPNAPLSSAVKVPMSDEKPKEEPKKTKEDIKMPPRNVTTVVDKEKEREEREKKIWADEISGAMIANLLTYTSTPQGKAKVLQSLNVAAGLSNETTLRGGNVFNLHTTRLLKYDNNNTGIVRAEFDATPMFPGRKIRLAINVKDKKVPIKWFVDSKVGTTTGLTANNKDLSAWVIDQLIPRVWKTFAATFAGEIGDISGEAEDVDAEEQAESLGDAIQDENKEPELLFGKKTNYVSEMDFISAHAAMLPVVDFVTDLDLLGGSLEAQRGKRFNINKAAMGLDAGEIQRLKIVRQNMTQLFTPDSQKVITAIRNNLKVEVGEPVAPNGALFEMEEPEEVEEVQFTADYRVGVKAVVEEAEESEEEDE